MNGTQQYQYQGEITPESEIAALKAEAGIFQKQIDVLNERIRELEEIAARKEG
jgi:predicted  nucleic acid-binding Zn-ribbon protein